MQSGLILMGGRGMRLGGAEKARLEIGGVSLLERVRARLAPQVTQLAVSRRTADDALSKYDLPAVIDDPGTGGGPLAGILSGLRWTRDTFGDEALMVSVPVDVPFIPTDLVARLADARKREDASVAVATSVSGVHHAVALWPVSLAEVLGVWLGGAGRHAVQDFLAERTCARVDFGGDYDPLFNINTPEDLDEAGRIAAANGL